MKTIKGISLDNFFYLRAIIFAHVLVLFMACLDFLKKTSKFIYLLRFLAVMAGSSFLYSILDYLLAPSGAQEIFQKIDLGLLGLTFTFLFTLPKFQMALFASFFFPFIFSCKRLRGL